jgi:hypothetical protein
MNFKAHRRDVLSSGECLYGFSLKTAVKLVYVACLCSVNNVKLLFNKVKLLFNKVAQICLTLLHFCLTKLHKSLTKFTHVKQKGFLIFR